GKNTDSMPAKLEISNHKISGKIIEETIKVHFRDSGISSVIRQKLLLGSVLGVVVMGFSKEKNNFDSQYHPVIKQLL
ncbi:MAG: hypothetical protein ACKO90_40070, partial [Microcystis panniformis]